MEKVIEILDLDVEWISVCKSPESPRGYPQTGFHVVLKSDGDVRECEMSVTSPRTFNNVDRIVYGVVYAPGVKDLEGFVVKDPMVIKKAAWNFLRAANIGNVDTLHNGQKIPEVWVAESYTIRGKDPLFPEFPEGSWIVGIKADNPSVWDQFQNGELGGISLKGTVRVKEVEAMTEKAEMDVVEKCGNAIVDFVKGIFTKTQAEVPKVESKPAEKSDTPDFSNSLSEITNTLTAIGARLEATEKALSNLASADSVTAVKASVDEAGKSAHERIAVIESKLAEYEKNPTPSQSQTQETTKSDVPKPMFPVTQFFFGRQN